MPTYGRRDTPTEQSVSDTLDQRGVLNRVIRAQVRTIDAENGFVVLVYENMPGGGRHTSVRPLWMSFPDSKIGNPAWGRFMPQETDLVRVGFDYDDRPVILGHDISAERQGVGDGISGWPRLHNLYKQAAGNPNATGETAKLAQFIPLNPGEYDFMSAGGAYIYGNNRGRLYLAGGNVSITLIKNDLRISARSQLLSHSADDCELRFGQVRRVNQSNQLDEKTATDTSGQQKEFAVTIKKTISAGTSTNLATFKIGNVIDDSGAVVGTPNPYRFMLQSFVDAGTEACKMSIDSLGNWDVIAPTTATTGVVFDFQMGDWVAKFKKTSVVCNDINFGAVTAFEHFILGDTYRTAESTKHSSMIAAIGQLSTAFAAMSAGLTPAAAGLSAASIAIVAVPATAAPGLLAASVGIAATAAGVASGITALANLTSAITVFESKTATFLSSVTKSI